MKVHNPTGSDVFVEGHGVIAAGEEATVQKDDAVKAMLKDGVLAEGAAPADINEEEDG